MANPDGSGKRLVFLENAYVNNASALKTPHTGAGNLRRRSDADGAFEAGPSTGRRNSRRKKEVPEKQLDPNVELMLLEFLRLQLLNDGSALKLLGVMHYCSV